MRRRLQATAGAVALLFAAAAAAPLLSPYDPGEQIDPPVAAFQPPGTSFAAVHLAEGWRLVESAVRTPTGLRITRLGRTSELPAGKVLNLTPSGVADRRLFLLGSDRFGRDLLSRMLYGSRISLSVALLATFLSLTVGVAVGSAAALGGRLVDSVLMRLLDAALAFPFLFLVIALVVLFRPGAVAVIALLGATSWMPSARLVRAEILSLKERDFILAARASGQHPLATLFRHLLPNALTPVLIRGTLLVGNMILNESSLSFLGFGIQPPLPSWGGMIAEGTNNLTDAWWLPTFPGAAIALTVILCNLLGEQIRDALDPRLRQRDEARTRTPTLELEAAEAGAMLPRP